MLDNIIFRIGAYAVGDSLFAVLTERSEFHDELDELDKVRSVALALLLLVPANETPL